MDEWSKLKGAQKGEATKFHTPSSADKFHTDLSVGKPGLSTQGTQKKWRSTAVVVMKTGREERQSDRNSSAAAIT
jgi:hypothetical protein